MADGTVKHKITSDSSQYMADLERRVKGIERENAALKKLVVEARSGAREVEKLEKNLMKAGKSLLTGIGGGFGIQQTLQQALSFWEKINQQQTRQANKAMTTADARTVWSMAMPSDKRVQYDRELGALRSKWGIVDEKGAYNLNQSLYAQNNGNWESTKRDTEYAFQAMRTGVDAISVRDMMAAASNAGLEKWVGAYLIQRVGEESHKEPAEVAPNLAESLTYYKA